MNETYMKNKIILKGTKTYNDFPEKKIISNNLNNKKIEIKGDEENQNNLKARIDDLKKLIHQKKNSSIKYNNLSKKNVEKLLNPQIKTKDENNIVPSPSLFGDNFKIPSVINSNDSTIYSQHNINNPSKNENKKGSIQKKVYENHRFMVSKLRNDIYQGLGNSENIIEEKGIYPLIENKILPVDGDFTPLFSQYTPNAFLKSKKCKMHVFYNQLNKNKYNFYDKRIEDQMILTKPKKEPNIPIIKEVEKAINEIELRRKNANRHEYKEAKTPPISKMPSSEYINYQDMVDINVGPVIYVDRGYFTTHMPIFQNFKKKHLNTIWGDIMIILDEIEEFCQIYLIMFAEISCEKLEKIASRDFFDKPTIEDIYNCFVYREKIEKYVNESVKMFFNNQVFVEKVIRKVQTTWKTFLQRNKYKKAVINHKASYVIACFYNRILKQRIINEMIKNKYLSHRTEVYEQNKIFLSKWPLLKERKRTIIHIPSISRRIRKHFDNIKYIQTFQFGRLLDFKDPFVTLILVLPYNIEFNIDIMNEINFIFERKFGVSLFKNERIKIIYAKMAEKINESSSLTSMILYDTNIHKKIKSIIKDDSCAYIIPGIIGKLDMELSYYLNIPVIAPEVEKFKYLFSKSGARQLLKSNKIAIPPGFECVHEYEGFYVSLIRLIVNNKKYKKWLFKINSTIDCIGIAYIDINDYTFMDELLEYNSDNTDDELQKFIEPFREEIVNKVNIVNKNSYSNWVEYRLDFLKYGGVIEAIPSSNFNKIKTVLSHIFIEPDGTIEIIGTQEQIYLEPFKYFGSIFPQNVISYSDIYNSTLKIGNICYKYGIIGHLTIDYIIWRNEMNYNLYWISGLKPGYIQSLDNCKLFYLSSGVEFNQRSGFLTVNLNARKRREFKYISQIKNFNMQRVINAEMDGKYGKSRIEKRVGFYSNKIYHSNIKFFNIDTLTVLCQGEGLTYSKETHKGSIFFTYESLYSSLLSVLLVEESYQNILKLLLSLLIHIERNIISDKIIGTSNFYEILNFVDRSIKEINILNTYNTQDKNEKEKEVFKYTYIPYSIKATSKIKNTPEIFYNILESDEYISGPKTDFETAVHEKIDMPNIYPLFINPVSSTNNPYWKNGLDSKMALMDPETIGLLTKEIPSNKYIKQIKSFQKMQTKEKKKYIKDIKKNDKLKSKGQIKMFFNKAEEILNKINEKKKDEEKEKKLQKQYTNASNIIEEEKSYSEIENDILNKVTSTTSSTDLQDYSKSQSMVSNINFNEDQYEINSTSILNLIHSKHNYDSNSFSDIEDTESENDSESSEEDDSEDDDNDSSESESNIDYNEYLNENGDENNN
ncbi:hypothetical protein BCR32DRAFT_291477 [Anaeromyces robustus]|uniref:IQCH-like ATP-grasp domain-containing protein n=1 Tax=Anaeromyces robustus TaxID=1754192 RepID=A0A1Y1XEP8_9FUNG|nr:hypothetical protein BCR32DRAFT_291477 [Anaeromyces robustus]|eukprot:ORX84251.1 hypothetical protein BCR32DRAFT_291477 [Anaeromyces robustus]